VTTVSQPNVILGAALASSILALALLYLSRVDGSRALGWWAGAIFANAFRQFIQFFEGAVPSEIIAYGADLAAATMAGLFLAGTQRYFKRRHRDWLVAAVFVAAVGWATFAAAMELPFFERELPLSLLSGLALVIAGWAFLQSRRVDAIPGYGLVGIGFIAYGFHIADYPFLRPLPLLAPWGFGLSQVLTVLIAVGLLIATLKAREKELAEKTNLLQRTLENMGEGISVYDAGLRMITWNERLIDMVGLPRELYKVGTPFEAIVRYSAEHGEYGRGDIEEQVRERIRLSVLPQPHHDARWRFNGRYIELRRNPMPGGGFVTVYSDLTDRKRAEDALREAKDAAETANKLKSEILATMSHELRTPLNAIIGFSDMIRRETFGPVSERRYLDYAGDIHDSGTHLLSLINDILDVSKAAAGQIELVEDIVDVKELFDSSLRLVRVRAEESNVELVVGPAAHLPKLRVDERRLKQVLLNLLSNAIKFTPPGGRVSLDARVTERGDLLIRVADTGIGIAPSDIPKALSPFGQIESTFARRYPGTGLGLPLSKALIELHGGELHLESDAGKGTTVIATLPAARVLPAEIVDT
jgi:signal transduction histidine kinase